MIASVRQHYHASIRLTKELVRLWKSIKRLSAGLSEAKRHDPDFSKMSYLRDAWKRYR